MTKKVDPIPEGRHAITPYICVNDCASAIDFYKEVFGAHESYPRITEPSGRVGHAEITIGNSNIMLSDEYPDMGVVSPKNLGGSPVRIVLYVENVDEMVDRAKENGATVTRQPADQFYGDRTGEIEDPFGYRWSIQTHIEDVSDEELEKRVTALYSES